MSENSAIEWTDATWNPVLGCSKVSAGCRGCYAINVAWQKQANPNAKVREAYAGLVEKRPDGSLNWTGRVNLLPERLTIPLGWRKPKRIFVNSLSDLFHPDVPDEFIDQVFAIMAICHWHTFQVLTKRPERMAEYLSDPIRIQFSVLDRITQPNQSGSLEWTWPLPNVWLGTSVEDQQAADERIPHLLRTPAAVRFLSMEPLLGPVDIEPDWMMKLDWIITGGESGPGARTMDPVWARSLLAQCRTAGGVAFFHKQNGGRTPKANGRELDGRTWDEFPRVATLVGAGAS